MPAPLWKKLQSYQKNGAYPFHMPGHKCGKKGSFPDPFSIDITEIPGYDNLHHPNGIIKEAQLLCAQAFGAEESFFIVNGASAGVISAIMSVVAEGDKMITARNCHKCVAHGFVLSGGVPVYIMPNLAGDMGFAGGVTPESVERAFCENESAKGVIITSPTYEGFTSDIEKIAEIAHKRNKICIVDEAHGAHMKFHEYFPKTALSSGADIVIQSLHKTLPAMTQTALVHVQGQRVDIQKLKQCLQMLQTSSPSYVLMASMDYCRQIIETNTVYFEQYVALLEKARQRLSKCSSFFLTGRGLKGQYGIFDIDLGKLTFVLKNKSVTGYFIEQLLLKKYGIQIEMSAQNHFIAMTSIADTQEGFQSLCDAMDEIDNKIRTKEYVYTKPIQIHCPPMKMTPREAFYAKKKLCPLENALHCVCGEFITPYPPGIPLIMPGELITQEILYKIYNEKSKQKNDEKNIPPIWIIE